MTELKKASRGRPTNHSVALKEAERRGEQILKLTNAELDEVIESRVQIAMKGGRMKNIDHNIEGPKRSNQRRLGEKIQRKELNAATKLAIAEDVSKMIKMCCNEDEVRRRAMKKYGLKWKTLMHIVMNKEEWSILVQKMKLSKRTGLKKMTASKFEKKHGVGCRKVGAGRADNFKHIKVRLKAWLEKEREHGHFVDKTDLIMEFMELCADESEACTAEVKRRKVAAISEREEEGEGTTTAIVQDEASKCTIVAANKKYFVEILPGFEGLQSPEAYVQTLKNEAELMRWKQELETRTLKLAQSDKYRISYASRLLQELGAKLLQPKRMSLLSMEEEEARVKQSWMAWDAAIYAAAFADATQLQKFVAAPESFLEARHQLVIGMSDQIPVWVKIGRGKQIYSAAEVKARKTTEDFKKLKHAEAIQDVPKGPVEALKGTEDSTLTRTTGDSGAEKYRITYEARQVIFKFFDEDDSVEPEAMIWKGCLVVKGATHARLSNISLTGLDM